MFPQNFINKILQHATQTLSCPICKRHFDKEELKLKGMFERFGIIQAICTEKHSPILVTYLFEEKSSGLKNSKPLTKPEVVELTTALKTFDGNFKKYFNQI